MDQLTTQISNLKFENSNKNASMDDLINQITNLKVEENIVNNNPIFTVDNTIDTSKKYYVTSIQLNFYQLLSIFSKIPCVYYSGKCKYEWKISSDFGTFSIYDWNNKNSLLETTNWNIGTDVQDTIHIAEFMQNLCDALECYNQYYKCIEYGIFESDDVSIDNNLKMIKKEFEKNEKLLKKL